ncbi:MAG TPA: glycosyltransferase [Candidatus Acidoferrales bacterium]|nr:glycosyltransferase [Candidatus Acidoferrales bacterium]
MKILQVTQSYHPFLERGGPTVKVRSIAEGLARRGHTVTVLTSWYGRPFTARRVQLGSVEVIYLKPRYTYRATTVNAGLIGFCKKRLHQFDLVHIYGLYDLLGPVVAHYCHKAGVPYVVEPLGMGRAYDRSVRLKRLWHTFFGKPLLRHAALLIATSRQEEQEMIEDGFPREQVALRYNGVDLQEFATLPEWGAFRKEWALPADEAIVLFLGRLIPRKGADLLVTAFAQACPEHGRLVIAGPEGETGYVNKLRELARSKGVEGRTVFTGPLYGDQKKSALVDGQVFVLPSRYENFANGAAEAIACGMPVIVSDRCGIQEFVAGQVGLVVPREIPALVDSLRQLLGDADLYDSFRRACPKVAAQLSWTELLGTQEDLYARARKSAKEAS